MKEVKNLGMHFKMLICNFFVGYMLQKSKEGSRVESNPQLTIHGVA